MAKQVKNVIFLCGDSSLFTDRIVQIKKFFFPDQIGVPAGLWKEMDVPKLKKKTESEEKWINLLDSEITCASWVDTEKKIVIIREILDTEVFLGYLLGVFKSLPSNNYFIICDKNDVVSSGKAVFQKQKWSDFKKTCIRDATVVDTGRPFSESSYPEKIKYIVDEFAKKSKKISNEDSSLFLQIVGENKVAINTDISKISVAIDSDVIGRDDVIEMAFPMSSDYPIWEFYSAINTGSYSKVMESADRMIENKFNYDLMLTLSLKQIRWHVIYSHLMLKDGHLNGVSRFSSTKDPIRARAEIFKMKTLYPRILHIVNDNKDFEFKNENPPSVPNNRDILNFLHSVLPKAFPDVDRNSLKQVVLNKNMERYLSAFNGLFDLRSNSKDLHEPIFSDTIRKISITK